MFRLAFVDGFIVAKNSEFGFRYVPKNAYRSIFRDKTRSVVQIRQGKACIVYVADSGQLTYEQRRIGSFNAMKLDNIGSLYAGLKRVCIKTVSLLMLLLDTLNVSACLCVMK